MRYASDNRFVRAVYTLTTGPFKFAFWGIVIVAIGFGVYFPVRDLYVAERTGDILARQLEIRQEYNDRLGSDVDDLLSEEGVKDKARKDLGLVMPGEKTLDVTGLDEGDGSDTDADEGSGDSATTGEDGADEGEGAGAASVPMTSAELEAAEQAVAEDAPWYIKMLDAVFMFEGVEGQEVASSGE